MCLILHVCDVAACCACNACGHRRGGCCIRKLPGCGAAEAVAIWELLWPYDICACLTTRLHGSLMRNQQEKAMAHPFCPRSSHQWLKVHYRLSCCNLLPSFRGLFMVAWLLGASVAMQVLPCASVKMS